MSRIRSLPISEMNKGMQWIDDNLTKFVTPNNASYWYSRCLDKLGGLHSLHTLNTDIRSHYWFRARAEDTFSEKEILNQDSFLHPPPEKASGGRANIPKHPVLYVSESMDDALLETNLFKSGFEARIAILEYSGKLKLDQYVFPRELSKINFKLATRANDYFKVFDEIMTNRSHEDRERAFHLHRLISNSYLSESHNFSSLLSYIRMYVYKQSDGVIYPSTKTLQTFNWALKTDISENCTVHRAFKLKCNIDGSNEILEVGTPIAENKLEWSQPTEQNLKVVPEFSFDPNYTPYKKINTKSSVKIRP